MGGGVVPASLVSIREVITPLYWPTLPLGAFLSTFKDSAHLHKVNGNLNGSPPPAAQPLCLPLHSLISQARLSFLSFNRGGVPLTQSRWSFLSRITQSR